MGFQMRGIKRSTTKPSRGVTWWHKLPCDHLFSRSDRHYHICINRRIVCLWPAARNREHFVGSTSCRLENCRRQLLQEGIRSGSLILVPVESWLCNLLIDSIATPPTLRGPRCMRIMLNERLLIGMKWRHYYQADWLISNARDVRRVNCCPTVYPLQTSICQR